MSIVWQYDSAGRFIGPCDDHGGPLPHNCTRQAPPARPWRRVWPRWSGGAWALVEDHRARRAEEGYAPALAQEATAYWLPAEGDDWQSPPRYMDAPGPLPAGAVTERPAKPAPTEAELFASLRAKRDRRITATDYLLMPDYPLNQEVRASVSAYRQALRDLPAQEGAPWDGGGEATPWPEQALPAG
ncbi:tail fiber assembly protein [Desulfovibrio sp. SGI.169]|uniref:tail fiber assembly protein n=1 Tax=Desulfovibrio sp. SGI.169 TaxID=3420561 RepID=UPI003D02EFC3